MSRKTRHTKLTSKYSQASSAATGGGAMAEWFRQDVSRRTASQRIGKGLAWTAVLGAAGVTVYKFSGAGDKEIDKDSLDLQKQEGWNVGATDKQLVWSSSAAVPADSSGKTDWNTYLDPARLIAAYQPPGSQWQPFFVPTLIQSLAQPSLRSQMKLIQTPEMVETYARSSGLRELLSQAQNASQTLLVADLEGPASIALGAALADTAQLVPAFDNWPHPLGVVRSHETIAAMAYYAAEVEQKKAKLKQDAPALLLLDNRRLADYSDQDNQFDNRWLAKLPPPDQLRQRGVTSLIYLVRDERQKQELDDLNDDFVNYEKNGIGVKMLRLSEFKPYDEQVTVPQPTGTPAVVQERHYYYGGSPLYHWWFYDHYYYRPYSTVYVYRGGRSVPYSRPTTPPPPPPVSYRPVSRPTIFAATRVGGNASGIGRNRPSGFGRTSVRVGSDGHVTGTRSGRSGSYGRSGGSWFGG
ncbi:MAG TPA: hypothetical protein VFD58_11020 [Blastocatellia bacterium]|nr:hypothetical protein [Blastocatellia bacterium]